MPLRQGFRPCKAVPPTLSAFPPAIKRCLEKNHHEISPEVASVAAGIPAKVSIGRTDSSGQFTDGAQPSAFNTPEVSPPPLLSLRSGVRGVSLTRTELPQNVGWVQSLQ